MTREELFSNEYYNLWILLRQVDQAVYRVREKELLRHNITAEQAEALFCIKVIGEEATPTQLARCIIKQPHSAATLIERMAKKGLVSKVKDLPRKNMARIRLTDKGEEAYKETGGAKSVTGLISCLTRTERQQLAKILEKLRDKAFDELGLQERPIGPPPLGKMVTEIQKEKASRAD